MNEQSEKGNKSSIKKKETAKEKKIRIQREQLEAESRTYRTDEVTQDDSTTKRKLLYDPETIHPEPKKLKSPPSLFNEPNNNRRTSGAKSGRKSKEVVTSKSASKLLSVLSVYKSLDTLKSSIDVMISGFEETLAKYKTTKAEQQTQTGLHDSDNGEILSSESDEASVESKSPRATGRNIDECRGSEPITPTLNGIHHLPIETCNRDLAQPNNVESNQIPTVLEFINNLKFISSKSFYYYCVQYSYNSCGRGSTCKYSHKLPTADQIRDTLKHLDKTQLVDEYNAMHKKYNIDRRFAACFQEECGKRNMTRILVEITADVVKYVQAFRHKNSFGSTFDEGDLNRQMNEALETALLYLDSIKMPLHQYGNVINYQFQPIGGRPSRRLIDYFVETIIEHPQHKNKYTSIFEKLAEFIIQCEEPIYSYYEFVDSLFTKMANDMDLFNERIVQASWKIFMKTGKIILERRNVSKYEVKLSRYYPNIHEEFQAFKRKCYS